MLNSDEVLLTTEEALEYLGISRHQLARARQSGKLPSTFIGFVIRQRDADEFKAQYLGPRSRKVRATPLKKGQEE